MKKVSSRALATPHPMTSQGKKKLSAHLNQLVADAFALYIKTKHFHWHVTGCHFRDYHLLFDEQASQIFEMIDILAERVRKIGEITVHSLGQINQLKTIQDARPTLMEAQGMIGELADDNAHFASLLRKAHDVAEQYQDVATTSLLEIMLDETERRIWFLFSSKS